MGHRAMCRGCAVLWILLVAGCGGGGGTHSDVTADSMGSDATDAARWEVDATGDAANDVVADGGGDVAEELVWGPTVEWTQLAEPAVAYRPWVRWWWPGADVEKGELERELEQLSQQGFGGAEIQAMEAALDPNAPAEELARRRDWGSARFQEAVRHTLTKAGALGLRVDLTAGSGWPMGGTHVDAAGSQQALVPSLRLLSGPTRTKLTFTEPDKAPFYEVSEMAAGFGEPLARYLPGEAKLVEVVMAKVVGGKLDPNVLKVNDSLTLDPATVQVLTSKLSGKTLELDVPDGEWAVVGLWSMPDGEFVSLSAEKEKGFVQDHFNLERVQESLEVLLGESTGYLDHAGKALRGFFNDSFEFKTERHYTSDFLDEFAARRGYDLRPWLPVVLMPGADNHIFDGGGISVTCPYQMGEDDSRIRYDYQLTVSDLFIERFIRGCAAWAHKKGLLSRVQPYGIRIDVIRAAGQADIAEAEQLYAGGADLFVKMVSSGAHLYNKNLVTAESLVWAGRDYMTTPQKIRAAADKLFAAGVNSLIYHGHPYRKVEGYGQQGWSAFSSPWSGMGTYSSNISEGDSFWPFMPVVNRYVARMQYLMQSGRAQADVLVYYPFLGFPASLARMTDWVEPMFLGSFGGWEGAAGKNPLFAIVDTVFGKMDPGDSGNWLKMCRVYLDALSSAGFTWDWVNDHSLAAATFADGMVEVRGSRYKAVVVVASPHMSVGAATRLAQMSAAGLPVVVVGAAPAIQPGYSGKAKGDSEVLAAWNDIVDLGVAKSTTAVVSAEGEGPEIVSAAKATGVVPHVEVLEGPAEVRLAHRYDADGLVWTLVVNPTGNDENLVLKPQTKAVMWLDVWNGFSREASTDADGKVQVRMAAFSSLVLVSGQGKSPEIPGFEKAAWVMEGDEDVVAELTGWELSVEGDDVAGGAFGGALTELVDWREIPELAGASSVGVYTASVALTQEEVESGGLWLSLGWVDGAAQVRVNGNEAGVALAAPFELDVTPYLAEGQNLIEVVLMPALRNRLLALGDSGDPEYVQFKGKADTSLPVGIIGPAQLVRVK